MPAIAERSTVDGAMAALRRTGNPFRNYFARNPDDEVCARYHVPELYAAERAQLLSVVDLYRNAAATHSEVVPVLGNKGAGKTHLLHTIKHGDEGNGQILVTPAVYQPGADFLEYLLFQTVDTLLGGARQKGQRPLDSVGDELTRRILAHALGEIPPGEKAELLPPTGLGRWTRMLGFGGGSADERVAELAAALNANSPARSQSPRTLRLLADAGLDAQRAFDLAADFIDRTEGHNTAGLMRRAIFEGFCKATLLRDESDLAQFLTNGFAELPYNVRPSRQDLVLALFKVLMEVFSGLKRPVVVAFDQLEDLLLARRSDDAHKIAEAFFAGIVQAMHQVDGVCFLVFAERGLWNRFVPSLDGYIQDRLNNPVHVPEHGTIKTLRLEAPHPDLVAQVVEARLRAALTEVPDAVHLGPFFPFNDEQVTRIAKTESTLRDMLQQFRHLFDRIVYDGEELPPAAATFEAPDVMSAPESSGEAAPVNRVSEFVQEPIELPGIDIKSVEIVSIDNPPPLPRERAAPVLTSAGMLEMWEQEQRVARRRLEPDGALTGATRELQAGLAALLQVCHEHGVKIGPWRLQHVVGECVFGEHPTYGVVTIAHWACKDGQPWKVGIGLFLARGGGKPKDLEVKLSSLDTQPAVLDHLILLRPDDDMTLSGKSKTLWQNAERQGHHARMEPIELDGFALIASFPRWLATLSEALPEGQPLPNLADLIQEKCERLLEQVCMPVTE